MGPQLMLEDVPKKTRKKKPVTQTIESLQAAGQDLEWYPTSDEMIRAIVKNLKVEADKGLHRDDGKDNRPSIGSVLDIGAGDGRVLKALEELCYCSDLYAIEKATVHIGNMPANIAIVGTDFEAQTLIDKNVDIIFCNPPYSRYEDWAVKIIKEGFCERAYLILPRRWKESKFIKLALESRKREAKVIWSGDFLKADRKARAIVDILCVLPCEEENMDIHGYRSMRREKTDPFEAWFQETFPEMEALGEPKCDYEQEQADKARLHSALVPGQNLAERLVELYRADMDRMNASYRALCQIDPELLRTVGVKTEEVKAGLKAKIKGLKNLYWQELFDHLDEITQRLTHASREAIVKKMASAVYVDFSVDNAYAVVLWVLKNANLYIDSQVIELFKDMSRPENIKNYVSNQKTWDAERWRYLQHPDWNHGQQETPSRYMLDYRIIVQKYGAIRHGDSHSWDYEGGLHKNCHAFLQDIVTVASNLGFSTAGYVYSEWTSGCPQEFYLSNGETLMRVRAFINGNLHLQLHQEFVKALNIEASRLLGWIKSPKEACDEMGVDMATAQKHWNVNRIFAPSDCKLLRA